MKASLDFIVVSLLAFQSPSRAAEHLIRPGDSPQAVLDAAAPVNRLMFLSGLRVDAGKW